MEGQAASLPSHELPAGSDRDDEAFAAAERVAVNVGDDETHQHHANSAPSATTTSTTAASSLSVTTHASGPSAAEEAPREGQSNISTAANHNNNNRDPDHASLVQHGLLCDEDTEAMLAEVEGTLHEEEESAHAAAAEASNRMEDESNNSSRKRKAEEGLEEARTSRHREGGGEGEEAEIGDELDDSASGSQQQPTNRDDDDNNNYLDSAEPDDGFVSHDHHHHHHPNLLDTSAGENASGAAETASGLVDSGEAVAAAAAAAEALSAAAATELTATATGPPSPLATRRGASRKSAPAAAPGRVSWEDRVEQLKAYRDEHGDLLIPIRYKKNPSLGKFVHNTREQFKLFHKRAPANYKKKCSLTQERIEQLDRIGFVWATERSKKQDEDWNARLAQLREYKEAHGDCLVPHGYKVDPSFAEWVHRQRTTYALHLREGRANPMVEGRMKKLEEMGFNFRVHVDKWTEHYEQLQEYRKQNGHCLVPTHFTTNMKLGRWVHTQRHQHRLMQRGRKSSMTEERAKLLEALGFNWEVRPGMDRHRVSWHERYLELKTFVEANGHFGVSPVTNAPLYAWCTEQLQRLKAIPAQPVGAGGVSAPSVKGMGQDRVKALAEIGFTMAVELAPVECEAGAAAVAAETAARELDEHSSHDEDDDHDHEEHHDDDDGEGSHHDEGDTGLSESAKTVTKVAAVVSGHENSGVSVEV